MQVMRSFLGQNDLARTAVFEIIELRKTSNDAIFKWFEPTMLRMRAYYFKLKDVKKSLPATKPFALRKDISTFESDFAKVFKDCLGTIQEKLCASNPNTQFEKQCVPIVQCSDPLFKKIRSTTGKDKKNENRTFKMQP